METLTMKVACLLVLLSIPGVSLWAADTAPPSLIAETWSCSYKDGKDIEDVLQLRDYMVSQAAKVELSLPPSFLWSLRKGNSRSDFIWFNVHFSLDAFGTWADAWEVSGIGPGVLSRFDTIADCVASMSSAQMIFPLGNPGAAVPAGPILISAESCNYLDEQGEESVPDLATSMHDVMQSMDDSAPAFATSLQPFTLMSSNEPDVIFYTGHASAAGWSSYTQELWNSDSGQLLQTQKDRVLECGGLSLWSSQQLIGVGQ